MIQAVVTGIEQMSDGMKVSKDVGVLLRIPPHPNQPFTAMECKALEQLRIHFEGIKHPGNAPGLPTAVDISESIGTSGEGGRLIDLAKLPPGTTHIRIWGTK